MVPCRSNFKRYFKVAGYLGRFTKETVVIAMGIPSLKARALAWSWHGPCHAGCRVGLHH